MMRRRLIRRIPRRAGIDRRARLLGLVDGRGCHACAPEPD